jgi:hypothetical protein
MSNPDSAALLMPGMPTNSRRTEFDLVEEADALVAEAKAAKDADRVSLRYSGGCLFNKTLASVDDKVIAVWYSYYKIPCGLGRYEAISGSRLIFLFATEVDLVAEARAEAHALLAEAEAAKDTDRVSLRYDSSSCLFHKTLASFDGKVIAVWYSSCEIPCGLGRYEEISGLRLIFLFVDKKSGRIILNK